MSSRDKFTEGSPPDVSQKAKDSFKALDPEIIALVKAWQHKYGVLMTDTARLILVRSFTAALRAAVSAAIENETKQ